ncbi:MAG: hypothetical protein ABFD05_08450 [Anaerolineaceae bacterium]
MKRRANPIFLVIGIIFSLMAVFVLIKMIRFTMFDPDSGSIIRVQPTYDISLVNSIPVVVDKQLVEEAPKQESEQWMTFDGMDLLDEKVGFTFSMRCPVDKKVDILPIEIIPWYPGVFEDGAFGIGKELAVAWEHLGYEGLWIHSGWDFWLERSPATDLQYFLETDDLNEVQPLKTMEAKLNECLLGSAVEVYSQKSVRQGQVSAAVRIPSGQVEELSHHTMDLVPYLASASPESGFAELNPEALLIYFCGRAALDEITDPKADYWTQTRYVIAITPVE